jgi:hypothetical protein
MILLALVPMALGLGGYFYVSIRLVTGSVAMATVGVLVTVVTAAALWFALPIIVRNLRPDHALSVGGRLRSWRRSLRCR